MRLYFLRCLLAASSLFAFTAAAHAADAFTLKDAITAALRSNPALTAQGYAVAAAQARRDHAGLRPPIEIGADVENVLGTRDIGAVANLEATLRLSTVLELGDKRALRVAAAERALTVASVQRDIQSLDILSTVTRRFIANLAFQEKAQIAEEHVARARQVLEAVGRRVNAGLGSPLEEGNALVHLREREIALAKAQADLRQSWGVLAATWGAPPDGAGEAGGDLYALVPLPPFAAFTAKLDANPYTARFAAERLAAEAQARAARAGRAPDVTVSAGVRRIESLNDQAMVFGFSMPLGARSRNAAAEREAEARAAQAGADESAARRDSLATLYGLYQQAEQSRAAMLSLRESILPVAEQTRTRAEDGFRSGRFSLFDVSMAQDQLHEIEEAAVDAAETYHQAIAEIERLTGTPFPLATPGEIQ